jgi:hypothetical protein
MNQTGKYKYAMQLLKELNCPESIMDALKVWSLFVREDEIKLHNWQALSEGGIVESEGREIGIELPEGK